MNRMICRLNLDNFQAFFLRNRLSTYQDALFTPSVDSYYLIMKTSRTLSTISIFGANIISLYLFSAKIC